MGEKRDLFELDVVIPCHNEEGVVFYTHKELTRVLKELVKEQMIHSYRLIFVDNGSKDETLSKLKQLFSLDPHVNLVSLRKNFGYQGSISAGLFHSCGDAAVTIDADLQDPPDKIKEMVEKYQEGFDLVLGVREDRKSDSFFKRIGAKLYYRILKVLGVPIVSHHGDFRLLSKELVEIFNHLPERNRFIRALIFQLDDRFAVVKYPRKPRTLGTSKFHLKNLFSLGLDGITSYSYAPLRIAALSGFMFSLVSFLGAGVVFYEKIVHNTVRGWASLILPLLFFSGIQLIFLGIIGEYIGKIYTEIKMRPLFSVREKYMHANSQEKAKAATVSKQCFPKVVSRAGD